MNQSILSGNLTADIEIFEAGGKHLCKFTIACNQGERTTFLPVEAWNMEHLPKFLGKGSRVLVSGTLKQDNWETKDGERRSRIVLSAHHVEFLDSPKETRQTSSRGGQRENSRSERGRRQRAA